MLKLTYRDYSDFSKFAALISGYLADYGETDEQIRYYVRLIVSELAGNVIKHSKCDADVSLMVEGDLVTIKISGGGHFNIDTGCLLPSLECESGRGVFIVKEISDSFCYVDGGKKAICTIRRSSH